MGGDDNGDEAVGFTVTRVGRSGPWCVEFHDDDTPLVHEVVHFPPGLHISDVLADTPPSQMI